MIGQDKVRVQVVMTRDLAEKVKTLAETMEASQSAMCSRLIGLAMRDNDWLIKKLTSRIGPVLLRMAGAKKGQRPDEE